MLLTIQEEQDVKLLRMLSYILSDNIKRSELCAADIDLLEELTLHNITDVAACGRIVKALTGIRRWLEFGGGK